MTDINPAPKPISRRQWKRLDVKAHNQAFDELKVRTRRGYPWNDDLFARKKQILNRLVAAL